MDRLPTWLLIVVGVVLLLGGLCVALMVIGG
jgi:hypothetical protein